jgi:UDP-3-O-[3-hydroxymyristoyl] glucosamine N-acyltransferase
MYLTDTAQIIPVRIVRDGQFETLGLLSHHGTGVLAGYYDAHCVHELKRNSDLTCLITNSELAPDVPEHMGLAVSEEPKETFYALHDHLRARTNFYWKDFQTEIAATARVHDSAYVAPNNVRIGAGTIVGPRAIVMERCVIGSNVAIGAGAIIGGEGFEPKWIGGRHRSVAHAGGVRIGDNVDILCGAHIARAVFNGFTEIGDGTKIDALVHIAHNVTIGRNCEIAANALVGGSSAIGNDVWIGPNACITSGVEIGDRGVITLGSVVVGSVREGARVTGYFAVEHEKFKRAYWRLTTEQRN